MRIFCRSPEIDRNIDAIHCEDRWPVGHIESIARATCHLDAERLTGALKHLMLVDLRSMDFRQLVRAQFPIGGQLVLQLFFRVLCADGHNETKRPEIRIGGFLDGNVIGIGVVGVDLPNVDRGGERILSLALLWALWVSVSV